MELFRHLRGAVDGDRLVAFGLVALALDHEVPGQGAYAGADHLDVATLCQVVGRDHEAEAQRDGQRDDEGAPAVAQLVAEGES